MKDEVVEAKFGETIINHKIVLEVDEDGMYIASVPSLQGCISEGKTEEEVLENIKDAIMCYLESMKKRELLKRISEGEIR